MIRWIRRWWKHNVKATLYVYVITIDGVVSLALYDKWEASEYCLQLLEKGVDKVRMIETEIL